MIAKCRIVGVAALLLLPGLASGQIRVRETWSSLGHVDEPVGYVAGMVQSGSTVLVSDNVNRAVYAYDLDTRVWRVWARSGSGPGELDAPTLMAVAPGGNVAVYDVGHRAILLYDANGRPLEPVRLRALVLNPKGFAVLDDRSFVISGGMFRSSRVIHRFDREGRLLTSWEPAPIAEDPVVPLHVAGGPVASVGDEILYSASAPHRIVSFTRSGRVVDEIAADSSLVPSVATTFFVRGKLPDGSSTLPNGKPVMVPRWWYDQSTGIYQLADGSLLNVITRFYRGDSVWEVYSSQGELTSRSIVQRAYRPWQLTSSEDLLASYRDPDTDEHVLVRLTVERR